MGVINNLAANNVRENNGKRLVLFVFYAGIGMVKEN